MRKVTWSVIRQIQNDIKSIKSMLSDYQEKKKYYESLCPDDEARYVRKISKEIFAELLWGGESTESIEFEEFHILFTKGEFPEVQEILEAQGYKPYPEGTLEGDDCVTATKFGRYMRHDRSILEALNSHPTLTIHQLREKYGVEQPKQKVYEAGFQFYLKGICALRLPDDTELWYSKEDLAWRKDRPHSKKKPHTLTTVPHHTVGKFYTLAVPLDLNDCRSYALCVGGCGEGKFVSPRMDNGVVVVQTVDTKFVSLLEVTPI